MEPKEIDEHVAAVLAQLEDLPLEYRWTVLEQALEQSTKTDAKLLIRQDTDPALPARENANNVGLMVCWHSRYTLGDEQPDCSPEEWFKENVDDAGVCLPLYLMDHSGITMSTSPFTCPWDSGQVGYIYASPEVIKKQYMKQGEAEMEEIRKTLEQEVKDYDCHLRGQVWGYLFGDDTCWGFVGDELEATGLKDYVPKIALPQLEEAWEARE